MMNEDDKTKKDNKSLNYLLGLGIVAPPSGVAERSGAMKR